MHAREIISTHPDVRGSISEAFVRCIERALRLRAGLYRLRRRLHGWGDDGAARAAQSQPGGTPPSGRAVLSTRRSRVTSVGYRGNGEIPATEAPM